MTIKNTANISELERLNALPLAARTKAESLARSANIEEMEKQGQEQLVAGSQLPATIWPPEGELGKKALVAAGVKFLQLSKGDPLFFDVELPKGWQLSETEHPMWSNLHDEKGRLRAKIFYKAAFYDRNARIDVLSRYNYRHECQVLHDYTGPARYVVKDGDKVLFEGEWCNPSDTGRSRKQASDWLDTNKPGWNDPAAYWDQP